MKNSHASAGFKIALYSAVFWSSLSLAGVATAQISVQELGSFGNLDQNNTSISSNNFLLEQACVPTAITNSLVWLSSTYNVPNALNFGTAVNTDKSLLSLMNTQPTGSANPGTSDLNALNGLSTYLTNQGISSQIDISGGQTLDVTGGNLLNSTATPMYLYDALKAGSAVDIGVDWANAAQAAAGTFNNGGHELSLTGISINADGTDGDLTFIDPSGGTTYTNIGWETILNNATDNPVMFINGTIPANNDDDPGAYQTAAINADFVISATPEPSSWMLGGLGLLAFLVIRRLKTARP
jgi:hypothetical protein